MMMAFMMIVTMVVSRMAVIDCFDEVINVVVMVLSMVESMTMTTQAVVVKGSLLMIMVMIVQ